MKHPPVLHFHMLLLLAWLHWATLLNGMLCSTSASDSQHLLNRIKSSFTFYPQFTSSSLLRGVTSMEECYQHLHIV